jgi:hypothetical protein
MPGKNTEPTIPSDEESSRPVAEESLPAEEAADEGISTRQGDDEPDTRQLRMIPKLATDIQPWRVLFQTMTPDPKVIGADVQDVAVIGRADPHANVEPDIDLAPFGGQSYGVSRRHAILLPTDDGLCLIDLDSTNGTWVNGVYLQPGQKYRLRVADRIEFGRLRLVVRVVGSMLQGGNTEDSTGVTRPKPKRR